MSEKTSRSARSGRRSRRRLIAWLTFALVGILMGAVWATGFATIGGSTASSGASPSIHSDPAATHTSALAGTATAGSPLSVTWAGRWGSTAATTFYTVDLSGQSATNTYNVGMLLSGNFDMVAAGWASLQLKVELKDVTSTGNCGSPGTTFDGTQNPKVMYLDTLDAGVYWNALAGGTKYCIGIAASNGQDTTGTFLRSANDTPPTAYPSFIATVDRA